MHWYAIRDGDRYFRHRLNRHYSGIVYKDGRRPVLSIGPGEKMLLALSDYSALWAWRKFIDPCLVPQTGINNCVFINDQRRIIASSLIIEAEILAMQKWPNETRFYTYVDCAKIKSANPGYCYKMAGWDYQRDEEGKPVKSGSGKLILEKFIPF